VALYFALAAKMPFQGQDLMATLKINARASVKFNAAAFEGISEGTKHALKVFLGREPNERPSAIQASKHVTELVEELQAIRTSEVTSAPQNTLVMGQERIEPAPTIPLTLAAPSEARPKRQYQRPLTPPTSECTPQPPQEPPSSLARPAHQRGRHACGTMWPSGSTASGGASSGTVSDAGASDCTRSNGDAKLAFVTPAIANDPMHASSITDRRIHSGRMRRRAPSAWPTDQPQASGQPQQLENSEERTSLMKISEQVLNDDTVGSSKKASLPRGSPLSVLRSIRSLGRKFQ
jgi:hypothetical protein